VDAENAGDSPSVSAQLIHLIIHPPNLNDTYPNSSNPLEIGPELTMDYPLDNLFGSSQRS